MKRLTRIDVASAAKAGGVYFMALGFIAAIGIIVWGFFASGVSSDVAELFGFGVGSLALLVVAPCIVGMYGIAGGALFAWLFNITSRLTGGILVELE